MTHHLCGIVALLIVTLVWGTTFPAMFAYFWLGETMGSRALVGALLLISGMIVSQWTMPPRPTALASD